MRTRRTRGFGRPEDRGAGGLSVGAATSSVDPMKQYHLDLDQAAVGGARIAVLPGDPFRVPRLAAALDPGAAELAFHREFRTWRADVAGVPVLVTSTGIGGPSTAIAIEELAALGVDTLIRVGTTGAIQSRVALGDLVVVTGAVRLDGASAHYAPLAYPAVSDHAVVGALLASGAGGTEGGCHAGVVVSSDTFYPGQERYESHAGYVIRDLQGTREEWTRLGCLAYEMEAATLLTVSGVLGLRAGCVLGVVAHRLHSERVDPQVVQEAETAAIQCAAHAVRALVGAGRGPQTATGD